MVRDGQVNTIAGTVVAVKADTICIHGDGPNALSFAHAIRRLLTANGVSIAPPSANNVERTA